MIVMISSPVKVLQRLKDSGITLNPDKCLFSMSRLQYLGQVIDSDGIRKDPVKVNAITELPEPQDVPDVRRLLGMVNQQMKFLPNLTEVTKPIRDLLKKDAEWIWDSPQKEGFDQLKNGFGVRRSPCVVRHQKRNYRIRGHE